ncbi:unnamed protein product [Phytophthora lilii]|uniref:Unnamed protein product n=1 Tax=Phytophthora lilii TaxID=2077276 RepID=A0A9W7CRU5_9STRA|nr:unnamed protein product [Phytophthora lilii]
MESRAADFFVQALYLVVKTLERVNRQYEAQEQGQELVDALASVDEGVAFATAELLQMWAPVSQKTVVDSSEKLSKLMGVAVVNVLLQPRNVGTRHTFHEHALLPSLPLRAFLGAKQWRCSVCERVTQTVGSEVARAACVYRCAACNFNLCRECFTRIPNVTGSRPDSPLADMTKPATDRFFSLIVPKLRHKTGTVVIRQIAQELRRRVLEVYPHNFQAAAEFAQLFHNLVASDKSAGVALVLSPPASIPSSGRPAVAWFPLLMRTWTMSLSTLLGPFLRASTMLDDTPELDAAVRAANHGSAVADCLRAQWTSGYSELRTTLQNLMQTLLADSQHPLVVDAMLCWLALTLMTADPRRRLNYDAHERLDGFLLNVTTMLLARTLPVLDMAQHDPSYIDASYHQSIEPVRVYASKDFPEVPLHYSRSTQDARCSEAIAGAEMSEIQAQDETCIAEYNIRRMQSAPAEAEEVVPSTFYPRLSCHEGVVCDRCEFQNIHGVRYKCAFCGDMDLCSDCFENFRSHQAATDSSSESESETMLHNPDHVFVRIESPIPVIALKHFQPLPAEWLTNRKQKDDSVHVSDSLDDFAASNLCCADCGDTLGTGQPDDVFYKCANCISARLVCAACLAHEEKLSNGNPNEMHAPGHVYFVVTDPWRRQLPIPWKTVVEKLHFRRLLHPPALIPRLRFPRNTEIFYVTLKYLHFGPLASLSRWLSMVKELQELQAFCACEEERFEIENQRQRRGRRRQNNSQRQSLKPSVHYKASKSRLEDIRVRCVKMELHLLASVNVAEWLVFYARTCRWLLHSASTAPPDAAPGSMPQDPFNEPLSHFSAMFSGFPEHFFFDLCDVVYLLGLEKLEYRDLATELKKTKQDAAADEVVDEVKEVVEPILIMLTQIVVAPKFTKNPHLRVEALRSLTTLLTFVSKGQQGQHRPGHRRMEALFKRHELLSRWLIPGLLQFHSDMDRYNASNNGLAFTSAVTSGDHMLWGFLPTRVSVTMLLRYLWQLPSQRQSLLQMLNTSDAAETSQTSLSEEPGNGSTQQLTGLVSGLWSDIAKLFDEAHNKITTLRQIHDLIEDSLDGSVVVLPFRRDMLDGYVAINAKQLRLTMRLLLEALELTSWFASIVSGESSFRSRSLSAPAAALRHVLLQPLVVEQAARTLSFLVASLANAHEEKEWTFSLPLVDDGKLLLAHLIVLVVRYSGHSALKSSGSASSSFCSPSSFWKIVRSSGDIMERRVGDLDTHVRWGLNGLCTRIESESYLGSNGLDDDDDVEEVRMVAEEAGHELDEDEALPRMAALISGCLWEVAASCDRIGNKKVMETLIANRTMK